MKLKEKVAGQWATILIDSSNTHNFVDVAVTRKAKLPTEIGKNVKVLVANGDQFLSEGFWLNIKFCIQGYSFEIDLFVINLVGCDVILRVQWLKTLGTIAWNFEQLTT